MATLLQGGACRSIRGDSRAEGALQSDAQVGRRERGRQILVLLSF